MIKPRFLARLWCRWTKHEWQYAPESIRWSHPQRYAEYSRRERTCEHCGERQVLRGGRDGTKWRKVP